MKYGLKYVFVIKQINYIQMISQFSRFNTILQTNADHTHESVQDTVIDPSVIQRNNNDETILVQ